MRSTSYVAMLLAGLLGGGELAADWPQFRGPEGQGHSSAVEVPLNWSATENVVWSTPIPGQGWSSPVLDGQTVFLTSAVSAGDGTDDLWLRLYRVDLQTGKLLGFTNVFRQDASSAPSIHGKNSHASPTPVVDGDRVYVHFGHQGTACLDRTGKLLWANDSLRYPPVHGNGGSPVRYQELLIFSCDGASDPFVAALDRNRGDVVWKAPRETQAVKKFSFSTPLVIELNGQPQVISPGSDMVCAFEPLTGREIWHVRYDGYSVVPRPVFGRGLVFVATGYNRPRVLAIRPDGRGDVTESHVVWSNPRGAPHTPSLLLVDDLLYVVSDRGVASCLEADTGEQVWQERLGGNYSASPLLADGKIFFPSEEGDCLVVRPGRNFALLAKNSLGERTFASYAPLDGGLIIRTERRLLRIGEAVR